MSEKNFQHVKDSRNKIIQQDVFADFKKLIVFNLLLGCLFFVFCLITYITPSEIQNIILISLVVFSVIAIIFNIVLIQKLKKAEEKYKKFGEEIIQNEELS